MAKTKFLVADCGVIESDRQPLILHGSPVEYVADFRYLASLIHCNGRSGNDVHSRIATAARTFGMLKKSIFDDSWLTLHTKRVVYNACVLAVLLYGSECWTPLRADVQALLSFHHHHVRSSLGLSRKDTWESRMTTSQLLELWGDPVDIADKIAMRRLEWLGHVVRMEDERLPKRLLFASMEKTRPMCGPRKRSRDCILSDVRARDALDTRFVTTSSSRDEWRALLSTPIRLVQQPEQIKCPVCLRLFSRVGDIKRHKCTAERQKRNEDQRGSCRCTHCGRWFRSKGGLAVHRCPEKRWCDSVTRDLHSLGESGGWFVLAKERETVALASISAATSACSCLGTRVPM